MRPVRVVFMGSDDFAVPVLRALLGDGAALSVPVEVVGVVTQPDRPAGRGRKLTESPTKALTSRCGIPVLQPERLRRREETDAVLALHPELIVVASFGQFLPAALLNEPRFAALNLHPSLLPLYRGPSPIASPILEGDDVTGTTLILMTPPMDAGPIVDQISTPIGAEETAGGLASRLADMSARLLLERLPQWVEGRIEPIPQDDSRATYTKIVRKDDGEIIWSQSANRLVRTVRAYTPWPGTYTGWDGRRLRVHRARALSGTGDPGVVVGLQDGALIIGTGDGLLGVTELQIAGGRAMRSDELVRGYPGIVGSRLG